MNRRAFIQAITAGLVTLGFTRPADATSGAWRVYYWHTRSSYTLIALLGRHREYRGVMSFEPSDTLTTLQGKFANLRHSVLVRAKLDGCDTRELEPLIDRGLYERVPRRNGRLIS